MSLHVACVLDPLERLIPHHDTSLAILKEAKDRGHRVQICQIEDLAARGGRLWLRSRPLYEEGETAWHDSNQFDLIFMRKDPPVDGPFLQATYLLDLSAVPVWNRPSGLREASEKVFALRFPNIVPSTLVSQNREQLLSFLEEMGGTMVVKPVDGFAGKGVFLIRKEDANRSAILEVATSEWKKPVMAQQYLAEIEKGDKRILLLDGKPIGALVRLAADGEFRANMAAGGEVARGEVSESDIRLIETIRPALLQWGLHFVGLDVIGSHITEINVTSPTGLQEIARLDGRNIAADVVCRWEELYGQCS